MHICAVCMHPGDLVSWFLFLGYRVLVVAMTEPHGRTRTDTDGHGRTQTDTDGQGRTRTDTDGHGRTRTGMDRLGRTYTRRTRAMEPPFFSFLFFLLFR